MLSDQIIFTDLLWDSKILKWFNGYLSTKSFVIHQYRNYKPKIMNHSSLATTTLYLLFSGFFRRWVANEVKWLLIDLLITVLACFCVFNKYLHKIYRINTIQMWMMQHICCWSSNLNVFNGYIFSNVDNIRSLVLYVVVIRFVCIFSLWKLNVYLLDELDWNFMRYIVFMCSWL